MKRTLITAALLTMFTGGALAAYPGTGDESNVDVTELPDQASIVLYGTVVEMTPYSFLLDYGEGKLTVEMDDWEWVDKEAHGLIEGDKVTVYGKIDVGFQEARTIEASSVYVESIGTFFSANPVDEEDYTVPKSVTLAGERETAITGKVGSVSPDEEEFTIGSGKGVVTVDTSFLGYDVLDDKGFQQIDEGDMVSVRGPMKDDFVESMELVADSVTTYSQEY